jgi:hypothetical protein
LWKWFPCSFADFSLCSLLMHFKFLFFIHSLWNFVSPYCILFQIFFRTDVFCTL